VEIVCHLQSHLESLSTDIKLVVAHITAAGCERAGVSCERRDYAHGIIVVERAVELEGAWFKSGGYLIGHTALGHGMFGKSCSWDRLDRMQRD
jgi:hypothetical protein